MGIYFGKFALIAYIFSAITLGVGFLIFETIGYSIFEAGTLTAASMDELITSHNVTATANPNFIFGDYLAGLQAVGGIIFQSLTGGIIGDVLANVPFVSANLAIEIIFRIVITFCGAMLIINMLTGREL